ncbi:hypothetical protein ACLEIY_01925 [Acetobacter tropicalis]|uniref:hypothetical protein n=1 Tax=Acetobacter TaxID=434 RepID=UPI002651D4BC|nr:hypothetical protein [Acetobacter senegalensis]MDN7355541.1 hypothetical protein [Acetobacter senegalensis]
MCGISRFKTCDDETVQIEIDLPLNLSRSDEPNVGRRKATISVNLPREMINTSRPLLIMEKHILEAVRGAAAERLSEIIGAIHAGAR